MASSTVEDYLKRIYLEEQNQPGELISTGRIASALLVAPGTVTAMMKALAESGLVEYEPYMGVRLTPAGTKLATHVLRRHRLIELFLVEFMGIDWSEVHGEAEVLEHAFSDRLIERMDEMLGFPSVDPHGDPIPNAGGQIETVDYSDLLDCPLGESLRVARVVDQRAEFLRLLESHALVPGATATVESRDPVAETVRVVTSNSDGLQLGFQAASKVLVVPAG
ncbi:MAG: metal-dependent transcriptional regulator [Acidobacteriota bacterium]|nr:metal-dependent transcriptional regulator [Acidobacteriota bacterium]MDH3786134.1 metal-dependent transcriptional regulator [Acidobacteriota bacterium]